MSSTGSTTNQIIIKKDMEKEKYLVFEHGKHEYTIIKKTLNSGGHNKYVMKRSKGEQWNSHVRGEKLFTIIDDDMDITIKAHDGDLDNMAYHQLVELGVLINFVSDQTHMPPRYKIIRVTK